MIKSKKRGISFGLTSGVITTLGLMVGLDASTNSQLAVLGGILTIAIADAMSDALGIHISEEYTNKTAKQIWTSTKYTFLTKFFLALTFAIPIFFFTLKTAVIIGIIWGLIVLTLLSKRIARLTKKKALPIIIEHLSIAVAVIIITYFLGKLVAYYFV